MTLVWPFYPQGAAVESLEWLTDVHTCKLAEYRRCLRPLPRVSYAYKYQFEPDEYGIARELARKIGGDAVLVPDWPNYVQIPDIDTGTVSLPIDATQIPAYKAGRSALVWESNISYEVVLVDSINAGTISISATTAAYTTPCIVPLRLGTFDSDFSGDLGAHYYFEASASFVCTDTEDLFTQGSDLGYPNYTGYPLVMDRIELINGVQEQQTREAEAVDAQTSGIYKYPLTAMPSMSSALGWTALNAEALWNLRTWLHTRRGRWKQFWVPSWNADVTVTKNLVPGDGSIQIAAMNFAAKYTLPVDIAILDVFGGAVCVRITSVLAGPAGNELLSFSGALSGTTLTIANIVVACKLTLSRFDSDKIEIQHLPGRQATVVVATKEVPLYP